MFLYNLNLPEKMAFMQLAKHIVVLDDNKIDESEAHILTLMGNEMGISINDSLSIDFDLDQLADAFKSKTTRKICLLELISLAISNSDYDKKQSSLIESLASRFDMIEDEIVEIKTFIEKATAIFEEGKKLINF